MDICVIPFPPLPQPWQTNATSVRKSSPGEGQQQLAQKKGLQWNLDAKLCLPCPGKRENVFRERDVTEKENPKCFLPSCQVWISVLRKGWPFSLGDDVQPHKEGTDPSAMADQTKPLLCLCRFCPGAEELTSSIINFCLNFSNQPTKTVSNNCMSNCRRKEIHCGVCCKLYFSGNND